MRYGRNLTATAIYDPIVKHTFDINAIIFMPFPSLARAERGAALFFDSLCSLEALKTPHFCRIFNARNKKVQVHPPSGALKNGELNSEMWHSLRANFGTGPFSRFGKENTQSPPSFFLADSHF